MDSISTVWVSRFVCPSHKSSPLHGRNVVSKSFTNEPCNPFPLRTHFLINQGWGKGEKGKSKAELEASLGTKIEQLSGGGGRGCDHPGQRAHSVIGNTPSSSVSPSVLDLQCPNYMLIILSRKILYAPCLPSSTVTLQYWLTTDPTVRGVT